MSDKVCGLFWDFAQRVCGKSSFLIYSAFPSDSSRIAASESTFACSYSLNRDGRASYSSGGVELSVPAQGVEIILEVLVGGETWGFGWRSRWLGISKLPRSYPEIGDFSNALKAPSKRTSPIGAVGCNGIIVELSRLGRCAPVVLRRKTVGTKGPKRHVKS